MLSRLAVVSMLVAAAAVAQPGQPAPAQPSFMKDPGQPAAPLPPALKDVGIDQKLNEQVPLDTTFKDEFGRTVPLRSFFNGNKPVLLAPVYYECPMLCTLILNGVVSTLKTISFNPGQDFEVVAVSFDPKETPELALHKKHNYLHRYGRPDTANGWHFLTGEEANIRAVMNAVGFRYKYEQSTQQYAHASAIMLLTPDGRVSRYFYGVEYAPRDVRLGLVEASQNRIGNAVDQVLLYCYHYDPATGKYGAIAMNMVRFGGAAFALIGGTFLFIMFRRDWRADRRNMRHAG